MTFKEMYTAAKNARKRFVEEIQDTTRTEFNPTGVTETTILQWLSGKQKPSDLAKLQLQEHFKRPIKELFPD